MTIPLGCATCPKIPDGASKTRFQAVDFDDKAWAAYTNYRRLKATNFANVPNDEMVERVAVIVSEIEREAEMLQQAMNQRSLANHMLTISKIGAMKNGQ